MAEPTVTAARRFEFEPTPAVLSARARGPFIPCPACQADSERYLFHKMGARFVCCRSCGLVYANPPAPSGRHYFDIEAAGQHARPRDRELVQQDLADIVDAAAAQFAERHGRPAADVVLVGRALTEGPPPGTRPGPARVLPLVAEQADRLSRDGDVTPIIERLRPTTDVLILNELLEACSQCAVVVTQLAAALADGALVVVVFSNVGSFPARVMRRHWPRFFAYKTAYFDTDNLTRLMDRAGLRFVSMSRRRTHYTLLYILERIGPRSIMTRMLRRIGVGQAVVRVSAGTCVATFEKLPDTPPSEWLSVIVPVYNEAQYVGPVLDALLAKDLCIPKQIIVVESNSTDGSRDIVRRYEGRPGLEVIYEDRPRGKGSAVRRGLEAARGSIFLIQDADFEYDLDDYDALLEPILQRRTSFVLGSRSLGLDDWKVRRLSSSRGKALLMNLAQIAFSKTFNLLYQQRTTDVNTMFKVFRRECIEGTRFRGSGFNFDIELVCKIVSRGFPPMEIPVNYVARSFDEGKKINFISEFFPSYSMFFRCRFQRSRPT
jgi:hypothetical protein